MKLLKIIDATLYETEPRQISDHLELVLKDIRKRNFTASVIGGPDEDDGLCAMDVGAFSDELTYGHELSRNEEKRILERATRLAKARVAAGGLSHLKREECDRLEPSLKGMGVIMAKDVHWADEVAAKLHEDMPWMARATEYVWHALRRSAQRSEPITLRPVILNGPPGIGKSIWARSLAAALSVPYGDVDASKGSAGMALVGVERGWGSAQAGRPIDVMLAKRIANPLIVVDEVCKARTMTSTNGGSHSFSDALLSLLEPGTSKAWHCPYFRLTFDMSHLSWVLTSNTIENVPEPVRNRCQVIEIPDLTLDQLQTFASKEGAKARLSQDSLEAVVAAIILAPGVAGRRLSLRDVVRMLERAEVMEEKPLLQ